MKKILFLLLLPIFSFGQTKETIIHITTDGYPQETRWVLYADSMYGTMLEVKYCACSEKKCAKFRVMVFNLGFEI